MNHQQSKINYLNVPIAYDIETSAYRNAEGEPRAITYARAISVDGDVTIHRTFPQLEFHLRDLIDKFNVSMNNRLVIYVHNLAYEFSFMKHYFEWDDVFAIGSTHRIARALTIDGLEFRCSYLLTNTKLEHVGEDVGVKKMVGDLDYNLIRHEETPLTAEEEGYIINDVQILVELVRKKIKTDNHIKNIPMTKTGYVRKAIKQAINPKKVGHGYKNMLSKMPMDKGIYGLARHAYQGGYTHANAHITGEVVHGVKAMDISSSYPASMLKGQYALESFKEIIDPTWDDVEVCRGADVVFIVTVSLFNIKSKYPFPPISSSKTITLEDGVVDNGRVYGASTAAVTITNVDLDIYLRAYSVESIVVHSLHVARSGWLPDPIANEVLSFYADKTKLKGIPGQEERYKLGKENTNSIYGMVGTDPVQLNFIFDNYDKTMRVEEVDITEALMDHNKSRNRTLYYPWGAWVTAYSRETLLMTIYDLIDAGVEVLYTDTDSIYFTKETAHIAEPIIEAVNNKVLNKMGSRFPDKSSEEILDLIAPKTVKGERKPLGVFEVDGEYDQFKTLGAKRYATVKTIDGKPRMSLTVAGLSKAVGDHLEEQPDGSWEWVEGYVTEMGGMDFFKDGMTIPAGKSGRLTHMYSDERFAEYVTDYTGKTALVEQHGFTFLEESPYTLSLSSDYVKFINDLELLNATP